MGVNFELPFSDRVALSEFCTLKYGKKPILLLKKILISNRLLQLVGSTGMRILRIWSQTIFESFRELSSITGYYSSYQKGKSYLVECEQLGHPKCLQIGAGSNVLHGWLNTDLSPASRDITYLSAALKYPLPDKSFDYVFSEHLIEHLTYSEATTMLRECFRILRKGGAIRIATPDLTKLLALFNDPHNKEQQNYTRFVHQQWLSRQGVTEPLPANFLNLTMHGWGHKFLFDFPTLSHILSLQGFSEIKQQFNGESDDPVFTGLEKHGEIIGNIPANDYETLVVEAVK